mmetsp:Transcript_23459/g.28210  ORF Transcript_23459/g.28210 Transcript_23459/m.28210 type:complete len:230 (+) Transcript_23459:81-770(+)
MGLHRGKICQVCRKDKLTNHLLHRLIKHKSKPIVFPNGIDTITHEKIEHLVQRVWNSKGRFLQPSLGQNIVSAQMNAWSDEFIPIASLQSELYGQARLDIEPFIHIKNELPICFEDSAVFVTSQHLRTPLHSDERHALLLHVAGRKRVVIIDPETSDRFPSRLRMLLRLRSISGTQDDLYQADNYLLRDMRFYSFDLHPGDVLFLPKRWLHDIESLSNTISFALRLQEN